MVTKVQKWGNSQGRLVSKDLLEAAQIEVGDEVEVSAKAGRIIVEPVAKIRGRYKLEDHMAKMPPAPRGGEVDWGRPIGKEAW